MPFGKKSGPNGIEIDFDVVYRDLLAPAVETAGLYPHRADADRRGGSIHADMFQDLLLAEFVIADLTLDNPNVWYEIGVRHALRRGGTILTYAVRDRLPFDIAGQRMQRYTLENGQLSADGLAKDTAAIADAIKATLSSWRGRPTSPVYEQLPNLKEPDWKTLKVGNINEFWQALERWQSHVEIGRRKDRPGDIVLLAEETPNRVLELDALRTAAKALIRLNRPYYALNALERASQLDPDDVECQQLQGIALGRSGRYVEARELLERLATEHRDGESLGLLARAWKDEWIRAWSMHPQYKTVPLAAARETAGTLQTAAAAYAEAFCANPASYWPGINALTLGRLWEHVTGDKSKLDLQLVTGGLRWAIKCALGSKQDYWVLVSRAELALVEGKKRKAVDDYRASAQLAVSNKERFSLDSTRQQLNFLHSLDFRRNLVDQVIKIIDSAERQLDSLVGARAPEPDRVVLFSGHMIDDPASRAEDKSKPARFPEAKIGSAASRIMQQLDKMEAKAGDLGICGGACGGDLLFAEACLAREMNLEIYLARQENEFLRESVTFADPNQRWERSFSAITSNPNCVVRCLPEELGEIPEGVAVHERCNRWMLYSALSRGLNKVSLLALWDSKPSNGVGGTEQMVELMRNTTGRQAVVIDPATL
jgi:tetratricopeptide (TPR) repeat protein